MLGLLSIIHRQKDNYNVTLRAYSKFSAINFKEIVNCGIFSNVSITWFLAYETLELEFGISINTIIAWFWCRAILTRDCYPKRAQGRSRSLTNGWFTVLSHSNWQRIVFRKFRIVRHSTFDISLVLQSESSKFESGLWLIM